MSETLPLPSWLQEVEIIDSHVHIIDRTLIDYDVVEFKTVPALAKDWSESMYRAELPGIPVRGALFVEVSACDHHLLSEAEWVHKHFVAKTESLFMGIVASIPVEQGAEETAKALNDLKGCTIKGVRRLIQDRASGFCRTDAFAAGVREVARRGLPFELCIRSHACPEQCADVLELVEKLPECVFILDHSGKPGVAAKHFEPWAHFITQLAKFPNCYCKVSGLATEASDTTWVVDDLRPYVMHVISQFGYGRCLFGSDWFVSTLATTISRWVGAICEIVCDAQLEEKRQLFGGTARVVYQL